MSDLFTNLLIKLVLCSFNHLLIYLLVCLFIIFDLLRKSIFETLKVYVLRNVQTITPRINVLQVKIQS